MRVIKLKKLELDNFKCFKHKTVEFGDRTTVKGMNGIGKSTLYSGILWLLFDKDQNGNSATNIRPHNTDGSDIHFVDISVAATFDVDGREITLKKTQHENWVKPRGSQEKVFKGNDNVFECNGIPKKLKDFREYINDNLCDEETFLSCTNVMSFFRLDTKKRRAKLLDMAGTLTDADVIATDKEFEPLADVLADGTVDELMARSKGTIKRLNNTLKTIPARIDEQENSKVDIDVTKLKLAKDAAKEKIVKIESEEADLSKKYEEYQKASDSVLEIKFEMSDIERKANESLVKQRQELETSIANIEEESRQCENRISRNKYLIEETEKSISQKNNAIKKQAELWKQARNREFDENTLICPYCGQEYPEEKKADLKAEFEANKATEMNEITDSGNSLRETINRDEKEIESRKISIKEDEHYLLLQKKELTDHKKALSQLPKEIDVSGNEEYQKLAKQLSEKEEFLKQGESTKQVRGALATEKWEAQVELDLINEQLAKAQRNADIDERIDELQAEQRNTAQKVANEEKMLDLLERFNRVKMNMLTEEVNKHFRTVKFVLFAEQINGGYQDVCRATVNGTDYERGLNDSDCLLADLDILQAFQRMNDLRIFLFLDRAESINDNRIPKTESQLILLKVSEEREMVVKNADYLAMLEKSRKQLEQGEVVVKSMEELERMEDEYDAKIADEAYDEYIRSGKKTIPFSEVQRELNLT